MDPLEQLRDLHVPDPVSFWPPALGWWLVALVLFGLLALGLWVIQYRRKTAARRAALAELTALKTTFNDTQNTTNLLGSLSQLLRRYAIVCCGRERVAGLTGLGWLQFLDEHGRTQQFSSEMGQQAFAALPYGAQHKVNGQEMLDLVERWIKQAPLSVRKPSR